VDGLIALHILSGHNPIRLAEDGDNDDLVNQPAVWKAVYEQNRDELLPDWIAAHPGHRPEGWWEFEADGLPELHEHEEEVEYLHRHRLMGPEELAAIRDKAKGLARYNSAHIPGDPRGHFIETDAVVLFAAAQPGWLSVREREHLGLEPPDRNPA
jgi:hypothetical protein